MSAEVLYCPGCNVRFRVKSYDAKKKRSCPKCKGELKAESAATEAFDAQSLAKSDGTPKPMQDMLVGQRVAHCRVIKKLGQGGMGAVYQAENVDLKRTVALKVLPPELAADNPQYAKRFVREAQSQAAVTHPNVVMIYHVGKQDDLHFIEMEYVEGGSAADLLLEPVPIERAVEVTRGAAAGLAAAHEKGLVHRDIKPENIMISQEGEAKVGDFGLARQVDMHSHLTQSGTVLGTPYYMSPEQCEARPVDARTDVYSLGVTLYHLLTGEQPFRANSAVAIMYKHVNEEPKDPRDKRPEVPEPLAAVVLKAMAKDPQERYQTMGEFETALPEAEGGQGDVGALTQPVGTPPEPVRAPGSRKALLALSAAAVTLACAIGWRVIGGRQGEEAKHQPEQRTPRTAETKHGTPDIGRPTSRLGVRSPKSVDRYVLWKRLGPTVAVPGPDGKTQQLPAGVIGDIKYSPDGKCLAVAHSFGVDLYDPQTWQIVRRLDGHKSAVTAIDFTRDGKKLATAGLDGSIRVWDMESGRSTTLLISIPRIHQLIWGPEGRRLACNRGEDLCMLDTQNAKKLFCHQLGAHSLVALAYSPDGRHLARSTYMDEVFRIHQYDAHTGEEIRVLEGHSLDVVSLVFSKDGNSLVSGSNDQTIRIWDCETGKDLRTLKGSSALALAISPDGRLLASGSSEGAVHLWNLATGEKVRALTGHAASVRGLAFSPDGGRLVSSTGHFRCVWGQDVGDGAVRVWRTPEGEELRVISGYGHCVASAALSPDGQLAASVSRGGPVQLWSPSTGAELRALGPPVYQDLCGVAFSPDGGLVACGADDRLLVWSTVTGTEAYRQEVGRTCSVAFSPDGLLLASGGPDVVRLWNGKTGAELHTLQGHTAEVFSLTFSPDGSRLLSGAQDRTVREWEVQTQKLTQTLTEQATLCSQAYSPDGRLVAAALQENIGLWNTQTGAQLNLLGGHRGWVNSVAFSPDGTRLVSGSQDGTVRLWDVQKATQVASLTDHRGEVRAVALPRDGGFLMSASYDGTICLWRGE